MPPGTGVAAVAVADVAADADCVPQAWLGHLRADAHLQVTPAECTRQLALHAKFPGSPGIISDRPL